ncbi:MAG: hypothetical protein WD276_07365 [Actinomycetota bacterium]
MKSPDSDQLREPPGPRLLREFMDALDELDGVDRSVSGLLKRLHAEKHLKTAAIVSALRKARGERLGDKA